MECIQFHCGHNERTMCGDDDALASLHIRSDVLQPVRHHAVQSGLIQNKNPKKEWLLLPVATRHENQTKSNNIVVP